jgi:hypothetical protein
VIKWKDKLSQIVSTWLTYILHLYKDISINKGNAKRGVSPRLKIRPRDLDFWPWKSIGFQILLRSKHVPSLVKIHWRMLILECSQGCYAIKIWPGDIDLWPWKSIGFQTLLRTKYVPSLVKIHWRMLILVFTRMLCGTNLTLWPWKSIGFPTLLRTMYVPSLVKIHWRMLHGKNLTRWHWPLTLKINRVLDSPKD